MCLNLAVRITFSQKTEYALSDRQIPHWQTRLEMAAKLSDETDFGYLGVDIVLY